MLQDNQKVRVKFECCWRRPCLTLANIKNSPTEGFPCPTCGAHVKFAVPEILELIGRDSHDMFFEITLHRV